MQHEADQNYRKVAASLAQRIRSEGKLSVLFSSARRGEGTTTAVLNVAHHLKKSYGLRPLIVELDTQSQTIAKLYRLDESRTIQTIAGGRLGPRECVQQTTLDVPVIPGGHLNGKPVDQTHALPAVLSQILSELGNEYDAVLIDTPPILQHADAMALATLVPRVILVVEAGRTRYEMLDRVKRDLSAAGVTILGAVLNKHKRFIPNWIYRALVR